MQFFLLLMQSAIVFAMPMQGPPKLHFSPHAEIFAHARLHESELGVDALVVGAAPVVPAVVPAVVFGDAMRGAVPLVVAEAVGGVDVTLTAVGGGGDDDALALAPTISGFAK